MRSTIAALLPVLFAGCASQTLQPNATRDRAQEELRAAAQPRPKAAQPEAVDRALLPPLVVEMPRTGAGTDPRFDLNVNNAPANQVFMALVSGTRYSMLVHPNVKEPVSVKLKDVTVREALDAIRELFGYEYRIDGNRIFVQPIGLQTRVFQVNYLVGRRQGRADVRVTSGSIQSPTGATPGAGGATGQPVAAAAPAGGATQAQSLESSRITTTSDNDFWRDLQASLQSIVGTTEGRGVILNAQAGVAVVRGFPTDLRNAEQFLRTMQVIVERQVMLEAKIIEVLLSDGYQTGINWAAFRTSGNSRFSIGQVTPGSTVRVDGLQSTPTGRAPDGTILPGSLLLANPATSSPQNPDPLVGVGVGAITSIMQAGTNAPGSIFGLALQTSNFAALLNFLETQGTVHVLSSPRIATLNNQKAVLKVGTDEFFVTNVTTTTSSTGSTSTSSPTITVQPFFSGIALDVTPQIADNGEIILHVHPSVSSVTDKTKTLNLGSLGTITLPLASSSINESDTIVRVSDGSIVAIGGLMRQAQNDSRSGVPGLGEAPVLGNLFRSSSRSAQKSELVILLKTTVIHGDASWQAQAQEVNDRVQGMQRPAPRKE